MTSQEFPDAGWPVDEDPVDEYLVPLETYQVTDELEPQQTDLESMTVAQLKQHAADWDIDLGGAKKHPDILRIIRRAMELPEGEPEQAEPAQLGLDLSSLYEHMPPAFTEKLTNALRARGLVEPGDYFKPGAAQLFRSAMLGVIKHDFLSAQALAKKVWVDNAGRKRG